MATGALVLCLLQVPTASGAVPQSVSLPATEAAPVHVMACPTARQGLRFYQARAAYWAHLMGAGDKGADRQRSWTFNSSSPCPRYLANLWRSKAHAARKEYGRWFEYHYDWRRWMPDHWIRIAICESGQNPPNWRHIGSNAEGTFHGAFGFRYPASWDDFKDDAVRKAGPYPEDAWQATPRQQYEVALAIWRAYGFSGWGCRGA